MIAILFCILQATTLVEYIQMRLLSADSIDRGSRHEHDLAFTSRKIVAARRCTPHTGYGASISITSFARKSTHDMPIHGGKKPSGRSFIHRLYTTEISPSTTDCKTRSAICTCSALPSSAVLYFYPYDKKILFHTV